VIDDQEEELTGDRRRRPAMAAGAARVLPCLLA